MRDSLRRHLPPGPSPPTPALMQCRKMNKERRLCTGALTAGASLYHQWPDSTGKLALRRPSGYGAALDAVCLKPFLQRDRGGGYSPCLISARTLQPEAHAANQMFQEPIPPCSTISEKTNGLFQTHCPSKHAVFLFCNSSRPRGNLLPQQTAATAGPAARGLTQRRRAGPSRAEPSPGALD